MLSRILLRVFCAAILLQTIPTLSAYSVLSHEAVIDSCWNDSIVPVLSKRFPNPTQEQLREARAFAYGGSIIQDLGYYPFGSRFFSNLVHYVRSGDFVETMITEARDRNELAFAIGALAHYVSDSNGHSLATNRTVPLLYPELKRKYGNVVTFAEKPSAHIKVEFGFDVLQVARGKYVPEAYHEFIGFEVSKDLLDRSFQKTYGLEIKDVFTSTDLAIGTYRHTVSTIIPDLTQTAWNLKREEIQKLVPDANMSSFQFRLASGEYVQKWGKEYKKPGLVARITGFFFRIIPKFGPFKVLAFKPPTPEVEQLFLSSFDVTLVRFRSSLQQLKQNHLQLKNMDLDTGDVTQPGEYQLADQTYQKLLLKLQKGSEHPSAELVQNIRSFYKDVDQRAYSKKERQKILAALDQLAGIATSADSNAVRRSN